MAGPGLPPLLELSLRAVPGVRPPRGPGGAKVWGVARQVVPVPGEMAGGSGVCRGPGTQDLRKMETVTFVGGGCVSCGLGSPRPGP